ncbi:hypothetical protein LOD99_2558 [Oopsacas minuta]|uniref:Uncharacterized protein n=1 Tax=Oopsacas minuta TaxID=111878 RepID=A0AAV7K3W5_9METZ|nr:hypothetical protein LOD99_2558 [Oopsacas minuta]
MAEKLGASTVYSVFVSILKIEHSVKISFDNLFDNIDEEKIGSIEWVKFENIIQGAYILPDYTEVHKARLENLRRTVKNRRTSQRYYQRKKNLNGKDSVEKD